MCCKFMPSLFVSIQMNIYKWEVGNGGDKKFRNYFPIQINLCNWGESVVRAIFSTQFAFRYKVEKVLTGPRFGPDRCISGN